MTICIGALCASTNGSGPKTLVVASDRMVTLGQLTEFEHETPKIVALSKCMVALMAGDALKASAIIRPVVTNADPDPRTVETVAKDIAGSYSTARDKQLEIDLFRPRGMSRQDFYAGKFPQLLGNVAFQIDQHVVVYNLNVSLLVGGVDAQGAHLFEVANPGSNAVDFAQIGHQAIGSGQLHALHSLIGSRHSCTSSVAESLFAVYIAKKRSEVAPGVGVHTDLAYVDGTGIRRISTKELAVLDDAYKQLQAPTAPEVMAKVQSFIDKPIT